MGVMQLVVIEPYRTIVCNESDYRINVNRIQFRLTTEEYEGNGLVIDYFSIASGNRKIGNNGSVGPRGFIGQLGDA